MRWILTLAVLLLATATTAAAQQPADTRPGIAVLPFTNGGSFGPGSEDLAAMEVGVQQLLINELAANPELRVVERSRLREILDELDLAASGRVDAATAARIGQLVGARYMVSGVFMDNFGTFRLDGRIIDGETGEILRTEQVTDRRENLYRMLVDLAGGITERLDLPPLAARAAEQRREREIPAEAVSLYARAQVYEDGGRREQAIQLYQQIAQRFPEMVEAKQALLQLTGS